MREAYGYDAPLYIDEPEPDLSGYFWLIGMLGVLIWIAYGWI
jgi:hypothetical protein